ncbi:CCA tRNA nucleotidyltransferase [Novosphingobium tardum]|uniref:CCA tRNA nucleotidyltransferase n=1 Tax=Novosphingobium tardum TaxID=1538021 RepID=A0ABV8RN88_9SPHN
MARLPAAEWTGRSDLVALVDALDPEGDSARYVGGAVRDTLLGVEAHDIDIATRHEPVEVIARLDAAGVRSVPTGIAHGTVTAILDSGNVEITTLRHDVETDGRRAKVAFASDWQDDAARRDFTINALYADPRTGEVFDYFGGVEDLENRRVRFIGDARARIREDHLRILRYFRFQARFGSQPADEQAETACRELAPRLTDLSRERVGWELINLLSLPDPSSTVERMAELGVLPQVMPEANAAALAPLIMAERREGVEPDPIRRFAALLPADPATAAATASRLRLSNSQRKRLAQAARREDGPGNARELAYRLGRDEAVDRILLAGASVAPLAGWEIPRLPLKGGEVVARGIAPGPEVARILHEVENRWVAEGFPDADRVAELRDEAIAAAVAGRS